jgi:hypothetical protein
LVSVAAVTVLRYLGRVLPQLPIDGRPSLFRPGFPRPTFVRPRTAFPMSALMTFLCTTVHPLLPALRAGNRIALHYGPDGLLLIAQVTPVIVAHLRGAVKDGALTPVGDADVVALLASLESEAQKAEDRLTA